VSPLERQGVAAYLLIAFAGAWGLWAIPLALGLSARTPLFQLALMPGAFAPALAALIVRRWVTGEGFADAGLALRPQAWRHYLIALLLPYAAVAAILIEARLTGLATPDFTLQRALHELAPASAPPAVLPLAARLALPAQFALVAVIAAPLLWGEEFGWRGYLQCRWFRGQPLAAALATGIVWGVWHYPLIYWVGWDYPETPLPGLLVFPAFTVLLAILLGWLYKASGSIWVASFGHAATNAVLGSLTTLLFLGGPPLILAGTAGVFALLPYAAIAAWIIATGRLAGLPPPGKS
jgi:uncharacterized protein